MKIPVPYQIILKRLYDASYHGRIELRKAKIVISCYCRIPRQWVHKALKEMDDCNWIEFENSRFLLIKEKIESDIGFTGQTKYIHWTLKK